MQSINQAMWTDLAKAGQIVTLVQAPVTYREQEGAYDCDPWFEVAERTLKGQGATKTDLETIFSVAFTGDDEFSSEELEKLPEYGEGAYCINCRASL